MIPGGAEQYGVRRALAPNSLALAALRIGIAVGLLGLAALLLAVLSEAERGPQRQLRVSETAWPYAVEVAWASLPPFALLAAYAECLLPILASVRLRPSQLLVAGSAAFAGAGAILAWQLLGLGTADPHLSGTRARTVALLAGAALLCFLVGALHAALWLAANMPKQQELQTLPLLWQVALAALAAFALGGRWGWASCDAKVRQAAARRTARWPTPAAAPLPALDRPAEAWIH